MKLLPFVLAVAACGHASSSIDQPDPPDASPMIDAPVSPVIDAPPDASPYRFLCQAPVPDGAAMPEPPPLPAAGCPTLASGSNTITSSGVSRSFLLVVPANLQPDEKLPVLFLWYWIGGSANGFLERGMIQQAADDQRFIGVIPVDIGAEVLGLLDTRWPFDITQSQQRMDQEFTFFDDMLACVEQQYNVNQSCVSTVGVSAGALFTDQLAQARSNRLASFLSLSGGVNDTIIKPWTGVSHKLPGVVLWGGDGPPAMDGVKDILGCLGIGMDFSVASRDLEQGLVSGGQFFIECKHNCGHVEPPLDPPPGQSKYAGMWEFAFNHPFWLAPGESPYKNGLPDTLPAWCGIGANGATPRSGGGCPPAENPCAF